MQAALGRILPSSFGLFPLPKEAGTTSAENYDGIFSSAITNVLTSISQLPIVRVPANLPVSAAKALVALFGHYQLDPIGASSSHPHLDTFRRITDKMVYDTYGADNIVEVGPSLTRMAARADQCAAHSCSPNLDGRDRARAVLAAGIASRNNNHPHQADLVARGNMQWQNPVWMCANPAQNCNVEGRVLYASYSLQDENPDTLRAMMDAHNSSIAIVSLQLPVPLNYVDKFQETETGAVWELDQAAGTATCYPGQGDAGYTHKISNLQAWLDFSDTSLFAEILYQYGSSVVFRFSRNGAEVGTSNYPVLIKTMLDKYAYIDGVNHGIPSFLTSASHFDRLVAYLTTHHDKFAGNLFKAALERISVLTPAIVLGDDKYTDRWILTTDQRLSVAFQACVDVQKMFHRSTLAQRQLDVINTQLATSARRMEANSEVGYADWVLAKLRGEDVVVSQRTFGDVVADALDNRLGRSMAQTTHLPATERIRNGKNGIANLPAVVPPVGVVHPGPQAPPAPNRYVPQRLGYPQPAAWWPLLPEFWLAQLNAPPAPRGGRQLAPFDPAVNEQNAQNGIRGQPLTNLIQLQSRALNNWDWTPQTSMDLLLVGPGGTGKSTHARRIAPAGTCVVVPTNELQTHWQAVWPGHAVYTLDEAVANINLVRAHPAIIIDELYQYPVGHVITLCSQQIPVIGLGCPAQRLYNGPLGAGFHHSLVPIDHMVICTTVHRYGGDVTALMNRHTLPVYRQHFGPLMAQNFAFVTANPGVRNIQNVLVNRPGMHITYHRANTNVFQGATTIDAAQGTDAADVYVHLFAGDEVALAQNPHVFGLALTRARNTITFTVPAGTRQNAPLVQAMINRGLTNAQLVRRGNNVFGSRFDPVSHGFTSLDDLDHEEAAYPELFDFEEYVVPTQLASLDKGYTEEAIEDETPVESVISPALAEALYQLHPEPPSPSELHRDKTIIRFRKPDPRCRIRVPEWIATLDFHEPTQFAHIGYPFQNSEVLASVVAVFDRYTKPQNVAIPNRRAHELADVMFSRWMEAFIEPSRRTVMPTTAALFKSWFSNAKALRIAQVAEQLAFVDSGRPLQNEYFLKCQCKPKFKAFGFCAECGQGILATSKLLNATICPLIVAATKELQLRLKKNVVYDSGYTADQLDEAFRASTAFKNGHFECLSIDLSQQDSSHTNVHRFFIAKVLAYFGFDDTIVTLYLISRAKRFAKGLTMLGLLFEVIERLFSGEPGTALFNFLMSTGTSACSHDLTKFELFMGKGDDNSVIPPPKKAKLAVNIVRETGVIQKCDVYKYFDFANRIFTTSGRSFADPARMLAKYTMRMSKRDKTHDEWLAYRDQRFITTPQQHEELVAAIEVKHKLDYDSAHAIVSAACALHKEATYYKSLRPSKVPVEHMQTLRLSGRDEVVFENLTDRCAPEAIAFIADVPVEDVISYVCRLRLDKPAHPDVVHANRNSKFSSAFFMDDWEVRQASTKFGVRLAGADISLKPESGHVVVVRGKQSWRTARFGRANRLFGSVPDVIPITILCFGLAYALSFWEHLTKVALTRVNKIMFDVRRMLNDFICCCGPMANVAISIPSLMLLVLGWHRTAVWLLASCHFVIRCILLPFHWRAVKTANYKKPKTIRVEHALYGSTTNRVIHHRLGLQMMLGTVLMLCWLSLLDILSLKQLFWDIIKDNPFSMFGCMLQLVGLSYVWWSATAVVWLFLSWLVHRWFGERAFRTFIHHHLVWAMRLLVVLRAMRWVMTLTILLKLDRAAKAKLWHDNDYKESHKPPDEPTWTERVQAWSDRVIYRDDVAKWIAKCTGVPYVRGTAEYRARYLSCHPDKNVIPGSPECAAALATSINQFLIERPAACI